MGYPIYKKMGFWELDRIELDLAEFGWGGEEEKRVHVHGEFIVYFSSGI
jgi:hypothetical protein